MAMLRWYCRAAKPRHPSTAHKCSRGSHNVDAVLLRARNFACGSTRTVVHSGDAAHVHNDTHAQPITHACVVRAQTSQQHKRRQTHERTRTQTPSHVHLDGHACTANAHAPAHTRRPTGAQAVLYGAKWRSAARGEPWQMALAELGITLSQRVSPHLVARCALAHIRALARDGATAYLFAPWCCSGG